VQQLIFVAGVVLTTGLAAFTDWRTCRIPNKLTLPACVAGFLYQIAFHGWAGLADGGLAFAIAFGTFFLLWMIGGGGGGDVKLMGALSVWLGVTLTLYVMVVSTAFVILGTLTAIVGGGLRHGVARTRQTYLAGKVEKPTPQTSEQRRQRRLMAYAIPVALATWVVMWLDTLAIRGGQLGQ
jgi:prepilin peptidase CpaA